jgi:hypothetical protein
MLRGHLDTLVSSGLFEGWAYDTGAPAEPLLVAIKDDQGLEVACGFAHRYRDDLVAANCGIGWCAFQLRTSESVSRLRRIPLLLIEKTSDQTIFAVRTIKYVEGFDERATSVEEVTALDPTVISSVDQLNGCGTIFDAFIKARGVDAFVRAAYVYVLGRSADAEGLALYGKLIRQALLSPYVMLRTLAESSEFRSRPRSLVAPNMLGFPFRCS